MIYDGSSISTVTSFTSSGLTPGNVYQYRVSALNRVGEGSVSPYSIKIKAANVPGRPQTPTYASSSDSTIVINWNDVSDNGGALINYYKVYADNGVLLSNVFNYLE